MSQSKISLPEMIQSYLDKLYTPFEREIKQSLFSKSNEIYGELYYYSLLKLLKYIDIKENDHFLDIGSGLGRVVFQIFLTTNAASVTGVEINKQRHTIAEQIASTIKQQLPALFEQNHTLNLINDDFLTHHFTNINIIYVCSSVFSFDLLNAMGSKINEMNSVQKIVTFRKLPNLNNFNITKKLFLHTSWDKVACYIYSRKILGAKR